MKKQFLRKTFVVGAMLGLALTANAQFFQNTNTNLPGLHRGVPSVADFNNDGNAELYVPGETWIDSVFDTWGFGGWSVVGGVGTLQEDGTYSFKFSSMWGGKDILDENGEVTGHVDGGYTMDEEGNVTFVGNGIPPVIWNTTRWSDINNDGNIDFISMGEGGDDWQPTAAENANRYILTYLNGGAATDYTFKAVTENGLFQMANERNGTNAGKSSVSVGDYDKDGYLDIVAQGYYNYLEGEESKGVRMVALFRNNGDGTFQEMKVFNPLPYEECESPTDIYDAVVDADGIPTGEYVPTMRMKAMSHGAVMFGDLNADGWLDIVTTGWGNGDNAAGCFYLYKNNGDGTFQQLATDNSVLIPIQESELAMADVNHDGLLDILSIGSGRGGDELYGGKICDIYLNGGNFEFSRQSIADGSGLIGASESQVTLLDLNHDCEYDMIASGWSGDWRTVICTGNMDGTFTAIEDAGETGLYHMDSGGYCIGNILGKTSLDMITCRYNGSTTTEILADTHADAAQAPEAPAEVAATVDENGNVTVTWPMGESYHSYNVYFKNKETGWISQLLPADTETGQLRTIQNMQTAVLANQDNGTGTYTVGLPVGKYEVGVQAINPDATTSAFVKTEIDVTTDISEVVADEDCNKSLVVVNGGIRVNAVSAEAVQVTNAAGMVVATGVANEDIAVEATGVLVVKCGNFVSKIVKK